MEKTKHRITNGPSKEDLGLSVTEGKVVEFTVEGMGIVKAIVVSLKSMFNPMGDGTEHTFYGDVEGEAWLQSPNGKFLNDDDTLHLNFDYHLPTKQGSGNCWKGIHPEVENLYRQLAELEDQEQDRQLAELEEYEDDQGEDDDPYEDYEDDQDEEEGELASLHRGVVLSPDHPDYDETDDVLSEDEQMGDYEAMEAEGLLDKD